MLNAQSNNWSIRIKSSIIKIQSIDTYQVGARIKCKEIYEGSAFKGRKNEFEGYNDGLIACKGIIRKEKIWRREKEHLASIEKVKDRGKTRRK